MNNTLPVETHSFTVASITLLESNPPNVVSGPLSAVFGSGSGFPELQFLVQSVGQQFLGFDLRITQLFRLGDCQSLCVSEGSETVKEKTYSKGITIQFKDEEESSSFHGAFEQRKSKMVIQGSRLPNGTVSSSKSKFDDKIEASSAKMYFHYYGQLVHQQNMLQDYVRTGSYYAAVMENQADFAGRVVVDVGAGSGILSLFAAQAGAKHVYAVEASEMADYAQKLIAGNPSLGQRITVIKGKVEDVELPEKADILISEPMGNLLIDERMLESYVIARDRFLVPNGKMFPTVGRIHMAPFSDEHFYNEIAKMSQFWLQQNYYGVDLTALYGTAFQGNFSQPVVDAFDPKLLVAPSVSHVINFTTVKEEDLYEINIPLKFTASVGTKIHGLACWFDVLFDGSTVQRRLTTAPGAPTTHWYQLRCVLSKPIYVKQGQEITGHLHMIAHSAQSYTINLTMSAKMWGPGAAQGEILQTSSCKFDLKEPYYRMYKERKPDAKEYFLDVSRDFDDVEGARQRPSEGMKPESWLRPDDQFCSEEHRGKSATNKAVRQKQTSTYRGGASSFAGHCHEKSIERYEAYRSGHTGRQGTFDTPQNEENYVSIYL